MGIYGCLINPDIPEKKTSRQLQYNIVKSTGEKVFPVFGKGPKRRDCSRHGTNQDFMALNGCFSTW